MPGFFSTLSTAILGYAVSDCIPDRVFRVSATSRLSPCENQGLSVFCYTTVEKSILDII